MEPDFSSQSFPTLSNNQKNKKSFLDQSGQSMIEFILTFAFSIGILFLFVSLGLNFTTGYLAHYATFMASRTYEVWDNSSNTSASSDSRARTEAEKVFSTYQLAKYQVVVKEGTIKFNPPDGGKYEYVGGHISFTRKLSAFGLLGADQKLELVSEAFLGREPTRADCVARICKAMNSPTLGGFNFNDTSCDSGASVEITTEDNGC